MKIKGNKTAAKILPPKTYTVIPTNVSWSRRYKYLVESEHPVDTFLLDDEELAKFDDGKEVVSFGGFDERRVHRARAKLPYGGKWNLVISNTSKESTAVYYEIS